MSFAPWTEAYKPGDKVEIKYSAKWWPATVSKITTVDVYFTGVDRKASTGFPEHIRHQIDTTTHIPPIEPSCTCTPLSLGHRPSCEWKKWKDQA